MHVNKIKEYFMEIYDVTCLYLRTRKNLKVKKEEKILKIE